MDNDKLEKVINELNNLPTIVHYGFYQLRMTHSLRDEMVELLKKQMPKKVEMNFIPVCPECGWGIADGKDIFYCCHCGQAVKLE